MTKEKLEDFQMECSSVRIQIVAKSMMEVLVREGFVLYNVEIIIMVLHLLNLL